MARMQWRHKLILWSFMIIVGLPTLFGALYLWFFAQDQYISTVAFSVRKEDSAESVDILGGITQLSGGSTTSDTDILYDFLRSEDIVSRINQKIDLRAKFSKAWPEDPIFAFNPSEPIEELAEYWRRRVQILYDTSTRIITLNAAAFTREDAYEIATAAFEESSRRINELSDIAREDATRLAKKELARAQDALTKARQDMTQFRMQTQIIDPVADLEGQMGVLSSLQNQLAEALISADLLRDNALPSDQRIIQAEQKISAIRNRIADERAQLGTSSVGPSGESYAQIMSKYEKLAADMQFTEATYRAAQAAYDAALLEAQRQSRYLAAHIKPNIAESSVAPKRLSLLGMTFCVALLIWAVGLLIYYSVRDRR